MTASGWTGSTDELAELLAARFRAPALRWRMALQRGEVEVACPQVQEQALQMAEELRRMGVPVRVEVPAPVVIATGTQVMSAGHTLLGGPSGSADAAAPAGTVMGRPFGDDDDDENVTRYAHAAPQEAVVAPALAPRSPRQQPLPPADDLWAAALEADAVRQRIEQRPPADGPAEPPPATPSLLAVASEVARAPETEAPRHGWEAVLGALPAGPRPAAMAPAPTPDGEAWDERPTVVLGHRGEEDAAPSHAVPADFADEIGAVARAVDGAARPPGTGEPPKFQRLSRPDAPAVARDATLAALLSLIGPGAGQAYNGDVPRGLTFALLAPFGLPWVWSVIDAWRVASRQPTTPIPTLGRVAAVGAVGWALVATLGLVWTAVDRLTEPDPARANTVAIAPARAASRPPGPPPAVDETPAASREARETAVQGLLAQAQVACTDGVWAVCRSLAEQALDQDETNRDARRLHVWAVAALQAESEGSALPADSGGP